ALPTRVPRRRPSIWVWIAVAVVLGLFSVWSISRRPHTRYSRLAIVPPVGPFCFQFPGLAPPALSPSGRQAGFCPLGSLGRKRLWLRSLDSPESKLLVGTEDGMFPFWSPDERSIGFFASGKLRTIELAGGPAQILADCSEDPRGGTWAGRRILFAPDAN